MTFPGGGSFDGDAFGRIFGGAPRPSGPKKEKVQKGMPWRAKVFDGKFYVPLEQVAELLEQNDVLDKVAEGIRRRVEAGPQ